MNRLSISLLGTFQVRLAGEPVSDFASDKVRALLAYLAVEAERAHRRQTLAGLLWPDFPEGAARTNLRNALANLRRAIGDRQASPPFLQITRQTIQFNRASDYGLDVTTFSTLLAAKEAAQPAIASLEAGVALYRGPFLEGFAIPDSVPFEEWLLLKREALSRQLMAALHRLAEAYAERGAYEQALGYARRQVALEPYQEEGQQQVIRLLALTGRRSEALAQYETCRQVLMDELGVEPSAETVALYERIRSGALSGDAKEQGNRGAREQRGKEEHLTPAPRHNLPAQTTPFVGREGELAGLARLLDQPDIRLVTIFAPGGMGKTRLALEGATAQVERFQNGVYLVPLAPLTDPATMVSAIAEAVGYPFQADQRSPRQQLLDYFRVKELLLVLDNFEHLLEGVDLVTAILQAAPKVRILVTSRERLRLSSETVFVLAGLAVSDTADDGTSAAGQLFLQTAQRVRPTFRPTPADWLAIVQICRLVGGMPLGLILAAAWIDMLSPPEIAAEISRSLDFLAADLSDLPQRQRSLQAIFDTTWQRLSETEQDAFRKLSIFRGGFTREAAQRVTGAALPTLTALSHKSLIGRNPNGRYEIHELLRQFAWETLGEQMVELRDDHSAYYCAFLQQREVDLKGARQQAALAEIVADGENVRAAWQWGVERKQIDHLAQALDSLGLFYLWRSRLYEGEALCRLAVEQLATMSPGEKASGQMAPDRPAQARFRVRLLIWWSIFHRQLRQRGPAQQALRQAQTWLELPPLVDLDTRSEQAQLLLEQAEVAFDLNYETARDWVEQSLALYRTLNDPWRMAQGLTLLGEAVKASGMLDRASQVQQEGLALRQGLGDARGMAQSLKNLGGVARYEGKFEEAEGLLRRCISIFQELNDRGQLARGVTDLAVTQVFSGKFAASLRLFEEGLSIHHGLDLPDEPGIPTTVSGFALMHLGQYAEARAYLQRALAIYRKTDNQYGIGFALKNLGRIALAEQAYHKAQQLLQESLAMFRSRGDMFGAGEAVGCLGYVALQFNNRRQAQDYIRENLQIAVNVLFLPRMTALVGGALLRADQGETEGAIEIYTVVLQHGHVANSRWFEDVAGRQIAAAAETLPPEVVAAAQERGRARDTAATVAELLKELEQE